MKKRVSVTLFCLSLVCLTVADATSRTWYIRSDGSGDAPTVQAGIDSATAGDTVLVECGTYYEHDILMKSGIILTSHTGTPSCVTIDAQQQGALIICNSNSSSTMIGGLTLTNASSDALQINGPTESGPTIRDCVFTQNRPPAVSIVYAAPEFHNCLFYNNYSQPSQPSATLVSAYAGARPLIANCTLAHNSAGIAVAVSGDADIQQCIIAFCDGFSLGSDDMSYLSVNCTAFFGNGSARDDSATVAHNLSCIVADPEFCGVAGSHNYYLQSDSPCAPGNHPGGYGCGLMGALPVNCGTVEVRTKTWGTIKSLYKEDN